MTSETRSLDRRFTLVLRLGKGGQARVWLGQDELLKRRVVLKQLVRQDGGEDMSAVRTRAIEEARAMARVRHPAVVPIHDILYTQGDESTGYSHGDEFTGDPWLVMEFIEGKTLQELIYGQSAAGPLDDRWIARIGLDVLDGLVAAHRTGIVHRDVKPDNILIAGNLATGDCSVYLVDFGIAKINGGRPVTERNYIVGTPAYVAPERLTGKQVGQASDLWSLGVTLYCAVDGDSPFHAEGEFHTDATRQAILHDEPLRPRRASALTDIIFRMLVKDPDHRADADEVRAALVAIARGTARGAQPTVPQPGQRTPGEPYQSGTNGRAHPRRYPEYAPPGWRSPYPPTRQVTIPGPQFPGGDRDGARKRRAGPDWARMRVEDVRDLILKVGTDTGVAMLLSIPGEDAAAILASCPDRERADLLAGIASAQPPAASAIMEMLSTPDAARLLDHLGSRSAAVILAGMPSRPAVRILDATSAKTAARSVKYMPVRYAVPLFSAMPSHRAAAVLSHLKPATSAAVLRADNALMTALIPLIPETERTLIVRYLRDQP